jgi:hypothetical protein
LWCLVPASDPAKQIPQADLQPLGNLFDVDQGEISDAPFNAAVISAMEPASFRSFFLANPLPFAHTTDCATKTDADVGWHELPLSPGESNAATADESHSFCGTKPRPWQTSQTSRYLITLALSGFRNSYMFGLKLFYLVIPYPANLALPPLGGFE